MEKKIKITPMFDYPYCCMCFERLTDKNMVNREDGKWNVCKECEHLAWGEAKNDYT